MEAGQAMTSGLADAAVTIYHKELAQIQARRVAEAAEQDQLRAAWAQQEVFLSPPYAELRILKRPLAGYANKFVARGRWQVRIVGCVLAVVDERTRRTLIHGGDNQDAKTEA